MRKYVGSNSENTNNWRGNITITKPVQHNYHPTDHYYYSYETARYTANINDTNSTITCLVSQSDLYHTNQSITVIVEKIILPIAATSLTHRIGIISGVILAIIFLILICVLLTIIACRRQKRTRPTSSQSSVEVDQTKENP